MNEFLKAVDKEFENAKFTTTENGGKQFATTNSSLLDLFATIGAMRDKPEEEIAKAFIKAFNEDPLLATRMAFYARNIRDGGLGERRVFKVILKWLALNYPGIVKKNLWAIPEFGRWDDLFALRGTSLENDMVTIISNQTVKDLMNARDGKEVSLLGKWLPSPNASSKDTVSFAKWLAKRLHMREKSYRQMLTILRRKIDIVEAKMSAKKWSEIEYERVPSLAMTKHISAFMRHDPGRYGQYIQDVQDGKATINASALYPYDILR